MSVSQSTAVRIAGVDFEIIFSRPGKI